MRHGVAGLVLLALSLCAMPAMAFERHARVPYAEPDGERMLLTLWEPSTKSAELRPGLVMIHGGGWRMGSRMQMRTYGESFAQRGFVVASIQYRTMPGYAFPYCVYDGKAAVRWMRLNAERFHVDPDRIAVMGESAGGHIAGMLATTRPEDGFEGDQNLGVSSAVQAAVLVYAPLDFKPWADRAQENPPFWARGIVNYFEAFVTREQQDVENPYERASPITYVGPHVSPTLLIHGSNDALVNVDQSRRMFERLSEANVSTQLMIFEGVNHGFDHLSPILRRQIIDAIVEFLTTHMPAGSDGQEQ